MVLVPFSDDDRGEESVEDVNRRWVHDILPYADVPYDVVSQMGYGCNIMLAFNVDFDFMAKEQEETVMMREVMILEEDIV